MGSAATVGDGSPGQRAGAADGPRTVSGLELAKALATLTGELTLLQSLPHYETCEEEGSCRIDEETEMRTTQLKRLVDAAGIRTKFWGDDDGEL